MRDVLKSIFDNDYPGYPVFLDKVLRPIFGEELEVLPVKEDITSDIDREALKKANIKSIYRVAQIDSDTDVDIVEVFDVTLEDNAIISRSRVGIQRIIRSRVFQFTHAFMLFHYDNPEGRNWRFSYAYKRGTQSDTTEAKRYTYLFGKDLHCRTAIDRFVSLAASKKDNKALLEAFSVEALSDEFFDTYRKQYAKFVRYITGKEYVKEGGKWVEKLTGKPNEVIYTAFCNNEKKVRDYVKKLMGRITFLHFLQRKGWMCGDYNFMLHLFRNSNKQADYLNSVLEPLFFGILNTKPENRKALFEEQEWDSSLLKEWSSIPYLNGGLFEADEEDYLSIVFPREYFSELFEFYSEYNFTVDENDPDDAEVGVDPEMLGKIFENLLEDNKDKGAFYTPKEIVRYMCQESLIAYLVEKAGIIEGQVRAFVTNPYEEAEKLNDDEIDKLFDALVAVKICDPAIGSGAFPMGLLNELVRCEEALVLGKEENRDRAQLKREIIKNNIYGVDIEKGAIDIARLRFWLSLVVDEDTPSPLPNLDYKIMQGNSLLESYKGVDLSRLTEQTGELDIFSSSEAVEGIQKSLRKKLSSYYSCTNHTKKQQLQNEIKSLIKSQVSISYPQLDLSDIDVAGNQDFFLWHTWFSDVFNRPSDCNGQSGFDIVIGNPPYLSSKAIPEEQKALYNRAFQTTKKQYDLYSVFIELALRLSKENGVHSFIVPDSLIGRSNFEGTRKILLTGTIIMKWLHINDVFEAANVASLIYVCKKRHNEGSCFVYQKATDVPSWQNGIIRSIVIDSLNALNSESSKILFAEPDKLLVLSHLRSFPTFEANCTLWRGEELGKGADVIIHSIHKGAAPILSGEDVHRYENPLPTKWIRQGDIAKDAPYSEKKILIRQLGDRINATIDKYGMVTTQSVYSVLPSDNKKDNLFFYLGLLNSSLFDFIYRMISGDKQTFKRIILENIKALPLPNSISADMYQQVVLLVKQRLTSASSNYNSIEKAIDDVVYKLYDLSPDMIRIVQSQ